MRAGCKHISVCVPFSGYEAVKGLFGHIHKQDDVTIQLVADQANKREQLKRAIENLPSSIKKSHKVIVFADDDITYGEHTLRWMLAPFEKESVGAVGTCQRTRRVETTSIAERVVDWIFADYIERRHFENSTTLAIDGSISCLSGRMAAFRAEVV